MSGKIRPFTVREKCALGGALSVVALQIAFALWRRWPLEVGAVATDLILLVYLAGCFLQFQKDPRFGAGMWTVLTGMLFLAVDLKYVFHQDWLKITEVRLVAELFQSFPLIYGLPLTILALALLTGMIVNLQLRWQTRQWLALAPLLVWGVGSWLVPQPVLSVMEAVHMNRFWEGNSFLQKGVVFALLYDVPRMVALHARYQHLKQRYQSAPTPLLTLPPTTPKRNVHLFVLESFMDPVQMGFPLPTDPIDPRMRTWLGGSAMASTYGGGTAQAEFEVLCGTPVYDLVDTIVFHNLQGRPVDCLPHVLEQNGYTALSMVAAPRSYYNYGAAYQSVGFSRSLFQDAFPGQDKDGIWISNDEYIALNKATITPLLEQHTPIFNYMMTSSGHVEYELNPVKRPLVLKTTLGKQMTHMINNVYYNSRAIADYIEYLLIHDPTAIVIAVSDHQGYLADMSIIPQTHWDVNNTSDLRPEKYKVPYLFIDAGRKQTFGLIGHYEIPHLILASLKGEPYTPIARPYGVDLIRPMFSQTLYAANGVTAFCPNPNDPHCDRLERFHANAIPALFSLIERSGLN